MSRPTLPEEAVRAITTEITRYGERGVETGGFLLCSRGANATIDVVAIAGVKGILRRADQFAIGALAMEVICDWADEHEHRIAAQFHSHQFGAELSPIDKVGGMRMAGFVTTVIPNFMVPPEVSRWGWWVFEDSQWKPVLPLKVGPGPVCTLTFDAEGICGR